MLRRIGMATKRTPPNKLLSDILKTASEDRFTGKLATPVTVRIFEIFLPRPDYQMGNYEGM